MEQRSELAGQTAVVEVNQQMMIPEERGPKDGTRNFRDPEVLEEGVAKETGRRRREYVLIADPLAAIKSDERGEERLELDAGNTHSSAPESMRKCFPECRSNIDIVDGMKILPAAIIADRPWRFPAPGDEE